MMAMTAVMRIAMMADIKIPALAKSTRLKYPEV